jgi:hypothetical protein
VVSNTNVDASWTKVLELVVESPETADDSDIDDLLDKLLGCHDGAPLFLSIDRDLEESSDKTHLASFCASSVILVLLRDRANLRFMLPKNSLLFFSLSCLRSDSEPSLPIDALAFAFVALNGTEGLLPDF